MKSFIRKIILFSIPLVLLFLIVELVVPSTFFTFRVWEAARFKDKFIVSQFYPNVSYKMQEEGDLAHHTQYAVNKKVTWKTDRLGFRNDVFISKPNILIIGDSNIAGSSLSQDETLASSLQKYTGQTAYALAPANINTFIKLNNVGILQPPQILIVAHIERNILSIPTHNANIEDKWAKYSLNPLLSFLAVQIDKLKRSNSLSYLQARKNKSVGSGIQSKIEKRMFFLQGTDAVIDSTDEILDPIVKKIVGYKEYCDSIGSKFIFVPIPNKETIFWRYAGLKEQPSFIAALNEKLRSEGINTISTTEMFNSLLTNNTLPYHFDDTHWNSNAVSAVAQEISSKSSF